MRIGSVGRTSDLLLSVDSRRDVTTDSPGGSWYVTKNHLTNGNSNTTAIPFPPRHSQNMNILWLDLHVSAKGADDILNNRHQYFDADNP